ncbi:MAG: SDR family oxidoreductase [Alphaproteobacteria bacterium]
MTEKSKNIFCFGLGYSALATLRQLKAEGWEVAGTVRTQVKADALAKEGIETFVYHEGARIGRILQRLNQASHILQSVPLMDVEPQSVCEVDQSQELDWKDPIFDRFKGWVADARPVWFGYLSTTVVYGNHDGAEVTEETPVAPTGKRGKRRVAAENMWTNTGVPNHVFRLAGIYGPGRNALVSLKKGKAKRIDKPGQVFSRIHVDDIAATLIASIKAPVAKPFKPEVYNVCDTESAPPQDVIAYAADLLGMDPPPLVDFDPDSMTPMARSFYSDNKRVSSAKIRDVLGVKLKYPTYRDALQVLVKDMD